MEILMEKKMEAKTDCRKITAAMKNLYMEKKSRKKCHIV